MRQAMKGNLKLTDGMIVMPLSKGELSLNGYRTQDRGLEGEERFASEEICCVLRSRLQIDVAAAEDSNQVARIFRWS